MSTSVALDGTGACTGTGNVIRDTTLFDVMFWNLLQMKTDQFTFSFKFVYVTCLDEFDVIFR